MFCRNCGNQVREGLFFCTKCGAKLSADGTAPSFAQNIPSYNLTLTRQSGMFDMGKANIVINGMPQAPIPPGGKQTYNLNTPNVTVAISLGVPGFFDFPLKLTLQLNADANVQFAVRSTMLRGIKKAVLVGVSGATVIR